MDAGTEIDADAELRLALSRTPEAAQFQKRLLRTASIRFGDIVESIETESHTGVYLGSGHLCVTFRVEDVTRFVVVHGMEAAHSECNRLAAVFRGLQTTFDAERAMLGDSMERASPRKCRRARVHLQTFRTRRRQFRDVAAGYCHAQRLADAAIADLGPAWACAIFLQAEREYWMSGCEAGLLQGRLQDRAGVGWCNIDHHVYACSREHILSLVKLFDSFGYALTDALRWPGGVGAHVFVNANRAAPPVVVEVDTEPFERLVSPPWQPLSPPTWRRRVGLWCALHGESLLEGGLCRLAAHYVIDALRPRLQRAQVGALGPVQSAPGLRQFCVAGLKRPVNPSRVDVLEREGFLSEESAERIRLDGLVAAHLQCVERQTATASGYVPPAICDDLSESVPLDRVWRSKAPRRLRRRISSRRQSPGRRDP